MSNVFRFKSQHYIEWNLNLRSTRNFTSETFLLRDVKCNIRFQSSSSYDGYLLCESDIKLNPAVDIIVIANLTSCNSYGASNTVFKRTEFTGKRQEIWNYNSGSGYSLGYSLTFEVFTPMVHISKGNVLQIFIFFKKIFIL